LKTILHLCADIGSDSYQYALDPDYEVIKIGKDIGVENYHADRPIHGIVANPPCTEFQTINGYGKVNDTEKGLELVRHCLRIIEECKPDWWVMENPARGELRRFIGEPVAVYQPWQYGSPWTKQTALWGKFSMPWPAFANWSDVPKLGLYQRPGRDKPNLAFLHKSAIELIPEFAPFLEFVKTDADFRSLCSQKFAAAFKAANP